MIKYYFISLCSIALVLLPEFSSAQTLLHTTSEISRSRSNEGFARDHWFVFVENYQWSSTGKYYELYVTPRKETTIHVTIGSNNSKQYPTRSNETVQFRIPLSYEMTESGSVERKGIHVWSDDADLSVFALAMLPYTSGGTRVLPTSAWGKEYVVAAFNSHWAGMAGGDGDLPSEFAIVASQDSTIVTINPTTNIRDRQDADKLLHAAGKPFTVTLRKGEAVQYQSMRNPSEPTGFDFTGTTLSGNKPFGVVGGVMCANVPVQYPWCDYITEMLLPVDRWGMTYYTAPFIARKGGDTYIVIASSDGQKIYRKGTSTELFADLNKFEHLQHVVEGPSKWYSDKPFMLVQYCNSTSWPGYFEGVVTNDGIGDPSMMVITPVEQFQSEVRFQAPVVITSPTFTDYANLIVHRNAAASTTLDGNPLATLIDSTDSEYWIYREVNAKDGLHIVRSDSGVGVQVYGYGSQMAYASAGDAGSFVLTAADTTAPRITSISSRCTTANIRLADLGQNRTAQVKLSVDSSFNARVDSVIYSGINDDSVQYRVVVHDIFDSAFIRVVVSDDAGNRRWGTHTYAPAIPVIEDSSVTIRQAFGNDTTVIIPVSNRSTRVITGLETLLRHDRDFEVVRGIASLAAGSTDSIVIRYTANSARDRDTLLVTDGCWQTSIPLIGLAQGFVLRDTVIDFDTTTIGARADRSFSIVNTGGDDLILHTLTLDDPGNFGFSPPSLPKTIPPLDSLIIPVSFTPLSGGSKSGMLTVTTNHGEGNVHLNGIAYDPSSSVDVQDNSIDISFRPNPVYDILRVSLSRLASSMETKVRIVDAFGRTVWQSTEIDIVFILDVSAFPSGIYQLQCTVNGKVIVKRFSIIR